MNDTEKIRQQAIAETIAIMQTAVEMMRVTAIHAAKSIQQSAIAFLETMEHKGE